MVRTAVCLQPFQLRRVLPGLRVFHYIFCDEGTGSVRQLHGSRHVYRRRRDHGGDATAIEYPTHEDT